MQILLDKIVPLKKGSTLEEKIKIVDYFGSTINGIADGIKNRLYEILKINGYDKNIALNETIQYIISTIMESARNSIDAETTQLRINIKYDDTNNDIIIAVSDSGKGLKAKNNNTSDNSIGGAGMFLELQKLFTNDRIKLMRSSKGATLIMKQNLDVIQDINNGHYREEIQKIDFEGQVNISKKKIRSLVKTLHQEGYSEEEIEIYTEGCRDEIKLRKKLKKLSIPR